jgi:hypothetical protein
MYEIFASITDEFGSRSGTTGRGFYTETAAYDEMKVMQKYDKDCDFYVEYVPAEDEWNCY